MAAVVGNSGEGHGKSAAIAAVDIEGNGDELVALAVVKEEFVIGRQRVPMQHGALLEIPRAGFGNAGELFAFGFDQDNAGRFVAGRQVVLEIGLEADQERLGFVPGRDAVVAEEVVPGAGGHHFDASGGRSSESCGGEEVAAEHR